MKKTVYFHIDELARDAVVASNLKRALADRQIDLVYGNRASSRELHRAAPFDAVIFPSVDLVQSGFQLVSKVDCPVVILPTESVGGTTAASFDRLGLHMLGYSYYGGDRSWIDTVKLFCLWGEGQSRAMGLKDSTFVERSIVVGHPRHDVNAIRAPRPAGAESDSRIRVGLITRFDSLNAFDRRTLLEQSHNLRKVTGKEYWLSPDHDVEDIFAKEVIDLRNLFSILHGLDPAKYEIVIRVHPREDREGWSRLIRDNELPARVAPWDQPFMHWLDSVDHVVGPPSTSFYDCFVAGKKPICTMDLVSRRKEYVIPGTDDENLIMDHVSRPKSLEELFALLARPAERAEVPAPFREMLRMETNYPDSAQSLGRAADAIAKLVGKGPSRASLASLSKQRLIHRAAQLTELARAKKNRRKEQSANFFLLPKREKWIDELAGAKNP